MSKVLIVTGGGRGIGHCTALAAAKEGWDICVNYRSEDSRAAATVEAAKAHGVNAIAVRADVTKDADVAGLFATCDRELGRPTGLVNSAGIVKPYGRLDEMDYADFRPLMDLNVTAMLVCCAEAVKRMSTKHGGDGGTIVNVSSVSARLGAPGLCIPYAASKGAVDALTWGLAQEVSREGIRVNAVSPGVIDTEIQPPGRVEQAGPALPFGRVGQPEEVADAIVYLLSDKASYVSGANLTVSGAR